MKDTTFRVLLTLLGSSLLLGGVFWGGATYQRVGAIESHLVSIDVAIAKIAELEAVTARLEDLRAQVDRLTRVNDRDRGAAR